MLGDSTSALPCLKRNDCNTGMSLQCSTCRNWKPLMYFSKSARNNMKRNKTHTCQDCKGCRQCPTCSNWKTEKDFRLGQTACKVCETIKCANCGMAKDKNNFTKNSWHNYHYNKQNVTCLACARRGETPRKGNHRRKDKNLQQCEICSREKMLTMFRRTKKSVKVSVKTARQ